MTAVMTIVSARISPDRMHDVIARFSEAVRAGMPERRETTLLRGDDGVWRVITVWRSRKDLDSYLASVDEPFAPRLFREAGGVPRVEVLDVVLDSRAAWWS